MTMELIRWCRINAVFADILTSCHILSLVFLRHIQKCRLRDKGIRERKGLNQSEIKLRQSARQGPSSSIKVDQGENDSVMHGIASASADVNPKQRKEGRAGEPFGERALVLQWLDLHCRFVANPS